MFLPYAFRGPIPPQIALAPPHLQHCVVEPPRIRFSVAASEAVSGAYFRVPIFPIDKAGVRNWAVQGTSTDYLGIFEAFHAMPVEFHFLVFLGFEHRKNER